MLAITIATRGRSSMRWYNSNIQNWTSVTVRRSALRQYNSDAQKSAYDYYRRKNSGRSWFQFKGTLRERNVQVAWYGLAVVIGAIGATYAAVPLYKVFCQTTGFGGTTQRVNIGEESPSMISSVMRKLANTGGGTRVHTWTDEEAAERLATLRPVQGADLLTVRFDTTVGSDAFPWTFVPVHLDVKVVPGETALAFFRVTNHSDKPLTGVATYNVHPPKVGLYFQKIQCFCFEGRLYSYRVSCFYSRNLTYLLRRATVAARRNCRYACFLLC